MGKHTFEIEFSGIRRSKSVNIKNDSSEVENLILFIENDVDKIGEIKKE